MERDIADYAKDGRLTELSDSKRYEWRKMIDTVKVLGRLLTNEEAEQYRGKEVKTFNSYYFFNNLHKNHKPCKSRQIRAFQEEKLT